MRLRHRVLGAEPIGAALLAMVLAGAPSVVAAQDTTAAGDEAPLLREASSRESAGDMAGAEQVLRTVLDRTPTSLNALIAFERVLAVQNRTVELIPALDRLLEQDPESPIGHQMRVKAFAALDRAADVEKASEAWIAATPNIETPYREVARVWRQLSEFRLAVKVLEQGRTRIQRQDALALELGDVYAEAGDIERAVREWDRAIGPEGNGFLLVQRRVTSLPNGGAAVIPRLFDAMTKPPTTVSRQRAAVQIAIEAGLEVQAERVSRELVSQLEGPQRQAFLVEVARRADGAGLDALAYWAYGELVQAGGPVDQMLAIRTRLAELALVAGDTASAARAFDELEQAFAIGSPQRRQAVAVRIQLLSRDGELEQAHEQFDAFRQEFPDASELDRVAAALANGYLDGRDTAGAERVLTGVSGPRSGAARGRILITRGDIDRARKELLGSAPLLHGSEATEVIALAALLGRLSQQGGEVVAKAMARATEGEREESVVLLFEESAGLNGVERAAILEFAATLADRADLREQADNIRREIVTEHPRSREAPLALLTLARSLILGGQAPEEASMLLETLILEHPRSALLPQARRELDRLHGRIPPDGAS